MHRVSSPSWSLRGAFKRPFYHSIRPSTSKYEYNSGPWSFAYAFLPWSKTVLHRLILLMDHSVRSYVVVLVKTVWEGKANPYSVHFSRSVVSNSLRPHELQHTKPPSPSPTPGVQPNSCASSWWCHPAISSSVIPFSSCPQSFPASGSFQMS